MRMTMTSRWMVTSMFVVGCGADSAPTPYQPGDVTVIGQMSVALTTVSDNCSSVECEAVRTECGDAAAADVILDTAGNVVDVLCYKQDVTVEHVSIDSTDGARAGNNTVLVLDDVDDGDDVTGDVVIEGNNVVIWGDGPDVSVIGGGLDIQKNNAVVRGVRIRNSVTITKNNTQLAFCVIEGDLTITGNNTTLAECEVHGAIEIRGLNTVLVQNRVQGTDVVTGFNLTCNGNTRFDDEDADFMASDEELGGAASCEPAAGNPEPQSDP